MTGDTAVDITVHCGQPLTFRFTELIGFRRRTALPGGPMEESFLHGTVHEARDDLRARFDPIPKILFYGNV